MPPEKTKATIYDVAERAGVAISTVSRVLNNSSDVSEATRARVREAIEELRFRPDRTAKTLAQKQTYSLAVAIPTFTTPFHNELLKGVRQSLRGHDIDFLLCDLGSDAPRTTLLNFLRRGAVSGLLLVGVQIDQGLADELASLHAPVVLVGAQWPEFDSYFWDDAAGAKAAVGHLIKQGHRRVGMVRASSESDLQSARVTGYRQALDAAGIPFDEAIVAGGQTSKHAGFSEEAGYEAMEELLKVEPRITAVFCSSDVQAIGAWKAVQDLGKRVPEEIAIVGYDDIKTSQYLGLSSVAQSMHEIGERSTERLLERVKGEYDGEPASERVLPKLMVRRSSKLIRTDG